jgi:hypothetical protein
MSKFVYRAIGYFDEQDRPVICKMTDSKIEYCNISGFTILYIKEYAK